MNKTVANREVYPAFGLAANAGQANQLSLTLFGRVIAFDYRIRRPCWALGSGTAAPVSHIRRGCFVFRPASSAPMKSRPVMSRAALEIS